MIIQLKSKETGENFEDGIIEIEDSVMEKCFGIAESQGISFEELFNTLMTKYIKEYKDDRKDNRGIKK